VKNMGRKKVEETIKIKCLKCHSERADSIRNFYTNTNPLFASEKLELCKDCILSFLGDKESINHLDRVYLVLALLNKPFILEKWESCEGEWAKYIPQISSLHQHRGQTFKDSDWGVRDTEFNASERNPLDDEKVYNSKWMGEYTQADIDYLESYYTGLCNDFKVATTSHKDYARKICKASLHMDKCFQEVLNGISGADQKYKHARETFDTLSKSAQFSESQRGQNDVGLGGFGVTFDQVEQGTWIPKHTPLEPDEIDKMLAQFGSIKESV
jgi:hypothetical protein